MRLSTIPQLYRHANRWTQILTVLSKYGLAGWIERLGPISPREFSKTARERRCAAIAAKREFVWLFPN